MAEGLPEEANGIGERRKTTETESRSSLSTVYAWQIPTNQIAALRLHALAGAPECCDLIGSHLRLFSYGGKFSLCTRKLRTEMSVILASS